MKRLLALLLGGMLLITGCARQAGEAASPAEVVEKTETPVIEIEPPESVPVESTVLETGLLGGTLTAEAVEKRQTDDTFRRGQTAFSLALFQQAAEERKGENLLIAPVSVSASLGMAANGAAGETQEEMLAVLGGYSQETLNGYLSYYLENLPTDENATLYAANSLWVRDTVEIKEEFLQNNANYYGAEVHRETFDDATVEKINTWAKENTNGMIGEMVEELNCNDAVKLLNALAFEADWQIPFSSSNISAQLFTDYGGSEQEVTMMRSEESYYLETEEATGFLKDYKGGKYRFCALLPKDEVDLYALIAGLTAEELQNALQNPMEIDVGILLPQFGYSSETELSGVLEALGMERVFGEKAELSGLSTQELSLGEVRHKTFIQVTANGTRAGAATNASMRYGSVTVEKTVTLDRPFIYLIVDAENDLPVFMGVVTQVD